MNKLIHIPHISSYIPDEYISDYIIPKEEVIRVAETMKDHHIEGLLEDIHPDNMVIFDYSRVFCDVERFNSPNEEMNDIGMGVLYTHTHDLMEMRRVKNKEEILVYYNQHHDLLNKKCEELLDKYNEVIFIDLHSYNNTPLKYEKHRDLKRPDICIGIEEYHSDETMINKITDLIDKFGYSWSINEPFIGCLIPSKYYLSDKRVKGFMFEVNKDVFEDFEKINNLFKKIIFDNE